MVRWIALVAFALSVLPGCSSAYTAPHTITVSPDLPADVQVAAARARDAWCAVSDQTGWCPELVSEGGEGEIVIRHFPEEAEGAQARTCADDTVCVRPGMADATADDLDGVLTHEFGHLAGIAGHIARSSLMRAQFPTPADIPTEVDPLAVEALCEQQGC
jgi:hypothetical protein